MPKESTNWIDNWDTYPTLELDSYVSKVRETGYYYEWDANNLLSCQFLRANLHSAKYDVQWEYKVYKGVKVDLRVNKLLIEGKINLLTLSNYECVYESLSKYIHPDFKLCLVIYDKWVWELVQLLSYHMKRDYGTCWKGVYGLDNTLRRSLS